MSPISLEEAQAHLPELVAEAATGREIIIAQNGRPKARLVPLDPEPLDLEAWAALDDDEFADDPSRPMPRLMLLDIGTG